MLQNIDFKLMLFVENFYSSKNPEKTYHGFFKILCSTTVFNIIILANDKIHENNKKCFLSSISA